MGNTNLKLIENYSINDKKKDILELKRCANYYKENLVGKRFLLLYHDGEFLEILFKQEHFKHLTGISSDLNARSFFRKCIGMKGQRKIYIEPNEIYTMKQHPRALALRKMEVFDKINHLFQEQSFLTKTIKTDSITYSFGISDLELTLLCEKHTPNSDLLTPVSLRSKSLLKKSKKYYRIEYVFVKSNPFLKYSIMTFPHKVNASYFMRNQYKLENVIDYHVIAENQENLMKG